MVVQHATVLVAVASGLGGAPVPFTEEAVQRGLVYQIEDYPQAHGHLGFGCGFADLDGDGDQDVIVMGRADQRVGIFENDGTGNFADRTNDNGIPTLPHGSGFCAADYDGDGDLDIYFTQMGLPNVLVRNDGAFTFTDVSVAAGVTDLGATESASWGDFDNDGWVDLYTCNYNGQFPGTEFIDNKLYHNNGDGTFTDVAVPLTVDDHGYGFQAVWFDYDQDGDVDLYLSNDRGHLPPLFRPNQLWRNDNGQLVNVSESSGAGVALFSMGVACGDFDGNTYPDLYCTNIASYREGYNPLLLNLGNGTFYEASAAAGVQSWISSWGALFWDFDNSGRQDLYVNNMFEANGLFVNLAGFPCLEMAFVYNIGANDGVSFSSAVGDVDGDGDLDLICNNLSNNVELFINHEGELRNSIRLNVAGQWPNHAAIGANARTRVGTEWQFNEVLGGGNGYKGQNELVLHVGVDDAPVADEIIVQWPGGKTTRTLTNVPVNETWTIHPPERLGDANGDGARTLDDFFVLAACFDQPIQPGCEMMDMNGDSVIDLADAEAFFALYDDPVLNCDGDADNDLLQILLDPALDINGNGLLDACEAAGDVNGDGVVNATDLAIVLGGWGPCPAPPGLCFGDTNLDGVVNAFDIAIVLGNWD